MSGATPMSSLARLPAPSSTSDKKSPNVSAASAAAAKAAQPVSPAAKLPASDALNERITAMVESIVASKLSDIVAALPATTSAKPKNKANATPGRGLLFSLGANAGVADVDEDDTVEDDVSEDGADVAHASAAAAPSAAATRARARVDAKAATQTGLAALNERIADRVLQQAEIYGSLQAWVRVTQWTSARNRFECEPLAQGIDALLAEGVPRNSLGLEILLRRLTGVHLADSTGAWGVADAVAWMPHGGSLLPRNVMRAAYKDAEALKRATSSFTSAKGAFADSRKSGGGERAGGDTNKGFKYSKKDNNKPAKGDAAPPSNKKAASK